MRQEIIGTKELCDLIYKKCGTIVVFTDIANSLRPEKISGGVYFQTLNRIEIRHDGWWIKDDPDLMLTTLAHEVGHAIDHRIDGHEYWTGYGPELSILDCYNQEVRAWKIAEKLLIGISSAISWSAFYALEEFSLRDYYEISFEDKKITSW